MLDSRRIVACSSRGNTTMDTFHTPPKTTAFTAKQKEEYTEHSTEGSMDPMQLIASDSPPRDPTPAVKVTSTQLSRSRTETVLIHHQSSHTGSESTAPDPVIIVPKIDKKKKVPKRGGFLSVFSATYSTTDDNAKTNSNTSTARTKAKPVPTGRRWSTGITATSLLRGRSLGFSKNKSGRTSRSSSRAPSGATTQQRPGVGMSRSTQPVDDLQLMRRATVAFTSNEAVSPPNIGREIGTYRAQNSPPQKEEDNAKHIGNKPPSPLKRSDLSSIHGSSVRRTTNLTLGSNQSPLYPQTNARNSGTVVTKTTTSPLGKNKPTVVITSHPPARKYSHGKHGRTPVNSPTTPTPSFVSKSPTNKSLTSSDLSKIQGRSVNIVSSPGGMHGRGSGILAQTGNEAEHLLKKRGVSRMTTVSTLRPPATTSLHRTESMPIPVSATNEKGGRLVFPSPSFSHNKNLMGRDLLEEYNLIVKEQEESNKHYSSNSSGPTSKSMPPKLSRASTWAQPIISGDMFQQYETIVSGSSP